MGCVAGATDCVAVVHPITHNPASKPARRIAFIIASVAGCAGWWFERLIAREGQRRRLPQRRRGHRAWPQTNEDCGLHLRLEELITEMQFWRARGVVNPLPPGEGLEFGRYSR
jgi:hypothetical protein